MSRFKFNGAPDGSLLNPSNRRPVPDGFAELIRGGIFLGPGQEHASDDFGVEEVPGGRQASPQQRPRAPSVATPFKSKPWYTSSEDEERLAHDIAKKADVTIDRLKRATGRDTPFGRNPENREVLDLADRYFGEGKKLAVVTYGSDPRPQDVRDPRPRPLSDVQIQRGGGRNRGHVEDRIHFTRGFLFEGLKAPKGVSLEDAVEEERAMTAIHEMLHKSRWARQREAEIDFENLDESSPVYWQHEADLENRSAKLGQQLGLVRSDRAPADWRALKRDYEESQKSNAGQ